MCILQVFADRWLGKFQKEHSWLLVNFLHKLGKFNLFASAQKPQILGLVMLEILVIHILHKIFGE